MQSLIFSYNVVSTSQYLNEGLYFWKSSCVNRNPQYSRSALTRISCVQNGDAVACKRRADVGEKPRTEGRQREIFVTTYVGGVPMQMRPHVLNCGGLTGRQSRTPGHVYLPSVWPFS